MCDYMYILFFSFCQALQLLSAMELCLSASDDSTRVKYMQDVQSLLKEEVDKAQSLLNSSHDKAVKVMHH